MGFLSFSEDLSLLVMDVLSQIGASRYFFVFIGALLVACKFLYLAVSSAI